MKGGEKVKIKIIKTKAGEKMKSTKYQTIVRWGKMMGSYDYFIANEIERAEKSNAPITTIYERDGVWSVAEEISDEATRKHILGN